MALSPAARGCSVLTPLLFVVAVVVAAAVAAAPAEVNWAPRERHGAHSRKAPAPAALPSAAAPAAAPPTPGLHAPHGTAAAPAPGPTPPHGAEAPAPSPDHNDGGAAAVPFARPTALLVAAGVAAATMV